MFLHKALGMIILVTSLFLMIALPAKNVNSERRRVGVATGRIFLSAQDRASLFGDL